MQQQQSPLFQRYLRHRSHRSQITLADCAHCNLLTTLVPGEHAVFYQTVEVVADATWSTFLAKWCERLMWIVLTAMLTVLVMMSQVILPELPTHDPFSTNNSGGDSSAAAFTLRFTPHALGSNGPWIIPLNAAYVHSRYNQSVLNAVLTRVLTAAREHYPTYPCLCHHHFEYSQLDEGRYASLCVVQLLPNHWQVLINPVARTPRISTRVFLHDEQSPILGTGNRHRHSVVLVESTLPTPTFPQTADQPYPNIVTLEVHGPTAFCLDKALEEMTFLSKS